MKRRCLWKVSFYRKNVEMAVIALNLTEFGGAKTGLAASGHHRQHTQEWRR